MRNLFLLLALIGGAGIVFGVLTVVRGAPGAYGPLGFTHENYGGPGSVIGGLMLLVGALCLRHFWPSRE